MRRRYFATVLAGPSELFREGLTVILRGAAFRVVASVPAIQDLAAASHPRHDSILLIIESANDTASTIEQIELFKQLYPVGRVALIEDSSHPADIVAAVEAGANVCFARNVSPDAFVKALELVMLGETIVPARLLAYVRDRGCDDKRPPILQPSEITSAVSPQPTDGVEIPRLSAREKSILCCILDGASNKAIARKIDIAEATVKVHVKTILRKIRVRNRTQAAIWAMNNGSVVGHADAHGEMPSLVPEREFEAQDEASADHRCDGTDVPLISFETMMARKELGQEDA